MKKEIFSVNTIFDFLASLGVVTKKDTEDIEENHLPLILNILVCRSHITLLDVEKAMHLLNVIATKPLASKISKEAKYSFGTLIEKSIKEQQVIIKKEARKQRKRITSSFLGNLLEVEEM